TKFLVGPDPGTIPAGQRLANRPWTPPSPSAAPRQPRHRRAGSTRACAEHMDTIAARTARSGTRANASRPRPPRWRSPVSRSSPVCAAARQATANEVADCLEILSGVRRSETIARWVDPQLLDRIDHRAQLRAEVAPTHPPAELGSPRVVQPGTAHVCQV